MADRIRARCRFCRLDFYLSEVARSPEGRCPRCGRRLSPAYTNMVVREAGRVCRAHSELLEAVRLLVSLPGNLELIPHSLIRDLLEEVDWQEEIAQDRELIRREIDELEKMARSFARVVGHDDDHVEFRTGLRRLAQLLTRHADRLDAAQQRASEISGDVPPAGAAKPGAGPVRAAASRLEAVSAEHRPGANGEDDTAGALEAARASIEPVSEPETAAAPATAERSSH